jgi:hypothetical protein
MSRPVGRPTKYDKAFCEKVIELGKIGASQCEMALELDISWETFSQWKKEKPEFSDAVKEATRHAQGWWEKQGRLATFGGTEGFNATSFIFNMKNRFQEDWKDKRDIEHSGGIQQIIVDADDAET